MLLIELAQLTDALRHHQSDLHLLLRQLCLLVLGELGVSDLVQCFGDALLDHLPLLLDVFISGLSLLNDRLQHVDAPLAIVLDLDLRLFDELLAFRDLVNMMLHIVDLLEQVLDLLLLLLDHFVELLLPLVHDALVLHLQCLLVLNQFGILIFELL